MYTKVKKAYEKGIRYPVTVYVAIGRAYSENVEDFMGYIVLQDRSILSILIDNWYAVEDDLYNSIWTDITVFIFNFIICYKYI